MSGNANQYPIMIDAAGGEYMESVVVTAWEVKPGDAVKAGDTLVTVETAKAATEIAAGRDGYLARIVHVAGSEAPVGSVLGYLSDEPPPTDTAETPLSAALQPTAEATAAPARLRAPGRIIASPYARKLARQRRLDLNDIKGTGPAGRIKSRDLPAASSATQSGARGEHHPIILMHGFGADKSIWRWVIPLLQSPNRIVTLDLPGHGASRRTAPASIAGMALAVAEEIAALGLTDAHVVGHSLGGGIALALGAASTLRIHSLGLIAPAGLGADIDGDFLAGLVSSATPQDLQPWLDRMVGDTSALPPNFAGALLWQRKQAGRDAEQLKLAGTVFPGGKQEELLSALLKGFHIPVKLIWGKVDKIIPAAQALVAPGTVALHLLDGIGHIPQLECAGTVARLVDELVRSSVHQTSQEERT
jgi:pimeloyl-ACP methyl ester carboxylesterase